MYANKIKPIRKDGHRLLVTLLLANMIVNETLPVISDPVLGGGVQSVIVSTVLIVMYVLHVGYSRQIMAYLSRTLTGRPHDLAVRRNVRVVRRANQCMTRLT